jgi:hypothetical protein
VVFSESQGLLLALGLFWDKKKSILGCFGLAENSLCLHHNTPYMLAPDALLL